MEGFHVGAVCVEAPVRICAGGRSAMIVLTASIGGIAGPVTDIEDSFPMSPRISH
jgi:hypothetical protein